MLRSTISAAAEAPSEPMMRRRVKFMTRLLSAVMA
jgi:hypothetical protein